MTDLKKQVDDFLCAHAERYIHWGRELQQIPEMGFQELRTSAYIERRLRESGIEDLRSAVVTGKIAQLSGKRPGANICMLAEIDAVSCPAHPLADPASGMAHVCGHHMQGTALLALADALTATGVMKELAGSVLLVACPAEELIQEESFAALQQELGLEYPSGKQEFLRHGLLDKVDAVLSVHALVNDAQCPDPVMLNVSCNGYDIWKFEFFGKAAHSAVCPERGANALNAAVLTINGLQPLRETFAERDNIRMSYKLSDGGNSLSTVPDHAQLEVQVRASNTEALERVMQRVKLAASGAAQTLACTLQAVRQRGYQPYQAAPALLELVADNTEALTGERPRRRPHGFFSTDMGDISQKLPALQLVCGGFEGDLHGKNFTVRDETLAYVLPARILAASILDLLTDETILPA